MHLCTIEYISYTILMSSINLDINECLTNNGGCDQNCFNNDGSFYCTCNTGYFLSSNGLSCIGM